LYGWFTNETHTTWYRQEIPVTEEVPFSTEENIITNKPIKRRPRKK
jgi:hypothetical protein